MNTGLLYRRGCPQLILWGILIFGFFTLCYCHQHNVSSISVGRKNNGGGSAQKLIKSHHTGEAPPQRAGHHDKNLRNNTTEKSSRSLMEVKQTNKLLPQLYSQFAAPQQGMPQPGMPQLGMSQQVMPQQTMPQQMLQPQLAAQLQQPAGIPGQPGTITAAQSTPESKSTSPMRLIAYIALGFGSLLVILIIVGLIYRQFKKD